MKYLTTVLICFLVVLGTNALRAASRPTIPFPSPRFTAEQVIQKAQRRLLLDSAHQADPWVIISVRFGDPDVLYPKESNYSEVDRSGWSWFIIYANPITGSESVFQLTNDGKLHGLGYSQT